MQRDIPMIHAIKKQVIVQADGSILIHVPELQAGTNAEVIILESSPPVEKRSMVSLIGKGKGCFSTPEEADSFISHERESWE